MEFLQNLSEAKLFGGGRTGINKYNARDIADLLFLHICALQILKHEFHGLPLAQDYVRNAGNLVTFDNWVASRNELYVLIHILFGRFAGKQQELLKDREASQLLLERVRINEQNLRKYLRMIVAGRSDESFERRFLLELENGLLIDNSYYRAIRRISSTWMHQSESTKKLTFTRLLQIFRFKARRSELLLILEEISRKHNLEDKSLKPLDQFKPEKRIGLLKNFGLAGAGAVAGALAGYHIVRNKKS